MSELKPCANTECLFYIPDCPGAYVCAGYMHRNPTESNPPLTLEELKSREGKPVYNALNQTWYIILDVDDLDERTITMTDMEEFDIDCSFYKFYDHEPKKD